VVAAKGKAELRSKILAARRALSAQSRAEEADRLAGYAATLVAGVPTTCAYVPMGTEPGSLALLSALRAANTRVLLPLTGARGTPLDWAEFTDADGLHAAGYGLREPTGTPLGPTAITAAGVVLLPALAVDRVGNRLGRGAGFYDISLGLVEPGTRLVAVVRESEVLAQLPHEPHDIPVGWALTPAGLIRLGAAL
jgi:5-formyltetrahydrofolate cyclo-ligase